MAPFMADNLSLMALIFGMAGRAQLPSLTIGLHEYSITLMSRILLSAHHEEKI